MKNVDREFEENFNSLFMLITSKTSNVPLHWPIVRELPITTIAIFFSRESMLTFSDCLSVRSVPTPSQTALMKIVNFMQLYS